MVLNFRYLSFFFNLYTFDYFRFELTTVKTVTTFTENHKFKLSHTLTNPRNKHSHKPKRSTSQCYEMRNIFLLFVVRMEAKSYNRRPLHTKTKLRMNKNFLQHQSATDFLFFSVTVLEHWLLDEIIV